MTSSTWLAVGAVAASLVGPGLTPASLVLIGCALGVGVGSLRLRPGRGGLGRAAALAPIALGVMAIALRLAMTAGPASSPIGLPEGSGPWSGSVVAVSAPRDGEQVATVRLASPLIVVATTLPRFPAVEPGDRVRVDGRVEEPPDGPYGDYLARIGVDGTLRSRSLTVTGHDTDPGAQLERLRRAAGEALAAAIPEPEAGLAAGIVIGLRDRVDRDLAAAFTAVGASHVVAISGWNIAIVAATVAALAGRLARRRRAVILVAAIAAYVLFAGASASVVRAAAMAGVVLLARETGRAGRATAALGWAAALLLIADPALIGDAGFQLSTLATGGILAWANPLSERIGRLLGGRVPGWLAESLGVSLAAQAATLPVVLLTFGRLAVVSPIVNLAIVPLVAPAMAAAVVALVGGLAALAGAPGLLATLAGLPAWALLTAMCTVIRVAAALPFANVSFGPPWTLVAAALSAALILGTPSLARWVARRRHRRARPRSVVDAMPRERPKRARSTALALAALVAATAAFGLAFAHRADGTTRITVLDVGQGDSILVEGGRGGRMLVDGGPDPDRLLVELDRRLPPWDRRIDILVLTHPHEDHVAGMPLLLERYRIGRVYETGMRGPGPGYAAFARDLNGRPGAPPDGILSTGARIALDDVRFRVLWPDPGRVPREPPDGGRGINDVSIVLLGEVAGRRFLLTGDVEDDVDPILATRELPPVDILKVAHHGSATASTPAFLGRVQPRIAVVSSGAGNPYGHPARSTIDRLGATGARVMRTDTDGSVAISISPTGAIGVATSGSRRAILPRSVLAMINAPTIDWGPPPVAPPRPLTRSGLAFACGIPSG
jgi:competence protein ComEC